MNPTETQTALLDLAQDLAQRHGYNGFSYHVLARTIGIKTASIHYYFPSKSDLGGALMVRYRARFIAALAGIDARTSDPREKLRQFIGLFQTTLDSGDRLCLCGMLASEYATLPAAVQSEVRRFFEACEAWLARTLADGRRATVFAFDESAASVARTMISALEGAMISARTFEDRTRLEAAGKWLLGSVRVVNTRSATKTSRNAGGKRHARRVRGTDR